MSEHTPGPWQEMPADFSIDPFESDGQKVTASVGIGNPELNDDVVAIAVWDGHYQDPEFDANVRVLTAAPDLLSVVLDLFENPEFQVAIGGNPNAVERLMERAHTAIAKARGEP
jgi:hypothetical protein